MYRFFVAKSWRKTALRKVDHYHTCEVTQRFSARKCAPSRGRAFGCAFPPAAAGGKAHPNVWYWYHVNTIHRYWHDTIHRYYINTEKIFAAVHYLIIIDTVLQISNITAYTASDYIRYTNSDYDVESRWKSKFQHQCLFWFFDNL